MPVMHHGLLNTEHIKKLFKDAHILITSVSLDLDHTRSAQIFLDLRILLPSRLSNW